MPIIQLINDFIIMPLDHLLDILRDQRIADYLFGSGSRINLLIAILAMFMFGVIVRLLLKPVILRWGVDMSDPVSPVSNSRTTTTYTKSSRINNQGKRVTTITSHTEYRRL